MSIEIYAYSSEFYDVDSHLQTPFHVCVGSELTSKDRQQNRTDRETDIYNTGWAKLNGASLHF